MDSTETIFLQSACKRLAYYKDLADKTFALLDDADFHFTPNNESNSIAMIIQHVSGNMLSRWTDLLTTDGEKEWRNRDEEFDIIHSSKAALLNIWEKGWRCCLDAITNLTAADLLKTIYIRSEGLTVIDAINRQLAHYPYHIGQVIYIAKMIKKEDWQSLSIARKKSREYNRRMNERNE